MYIHAHRVFHFLGARECALVCRSRFTNFTKPLDSYWHKMQILCTGIHPCQGFTIALAAARKKTSPPEQSEGWCEIWGRDLCLLVCMFLVLRKPKCNCVCCFDCLATGTWHTSMREQAELGWLKRTAGNCLLRRIAQLDWLTHSIRQELNADQNPIRWKSSPTFTVLHICSNGKANTGFVCFWQNEWEGSTLHELREFVFQGLLWPRSECAQLPLTQELARLHRRKRNDNTMRTED